MGTKAPYQTKQMKQILAYLQTIEGTHVTAADVCSYFKEQGINVGTTTVYRNLEKMVEQGLVAKYNVDGTSRGALPQDVLFPLQMRKMWKTDTSSLRGCG